MKYCTLPVGVMVLLTSQSFAAEHHNQSDHHVEEEIVVSAPFHRHVADTALPVNVLRGEDYRKSVANSLGETLKDQLGVHSSSFGPGVGQAVIRGQSGNRVQVLQNSVSNIDAASVSPDHANGVEPAIATGIEVIRGPATLLYGNGAIGGIVNVLDERIPESAFDEPDFIIEQSHQTVNDDNKTVAKLNVSSGALNLHLDGFTRDSNDVRINGYAEEQATSGDIRGKIANTGADASGHTLGGSVSGDWGFFGISRNDLKNNYGLPPETHDGEQEIVRINMQQTRYDMRGQLVRDTAFLNRIEVSVKATEYRHDELEIEDGVAVPGTRFNNEGVDGRLSATHASLGNWTGVWGLQFGNSEFSALGDEAFIPKTDTDLKAMFVIERWESGKTTWEFGARAENTRLDPGGRCDTTETTHSLSASFLYDYSADTAMSVGFSRSERSPTLEERYSNIHTGTCAPAADPLEWVAHASTGLLEIGDPSLSPETANNLELGLRHQGDNWTAELNIYYNRISDFIYLDETGVFVDGQQEARYDAKDATFYGMEGRLGRTLAESAAGHVDLELRSDLVRASFDDGGDVPRIPPARVGLGLAWSADRWSLDLDLARAFKQSRTASNEADTDGYTLLSLYGDYHMPLGRSELMFFARGTNLLDEEIRNHTSFLKSIAPEPGRGLQLGIRFTY